MKKWVFSEVVSLLLIILFTYAALTKLFDFDRFNIQIGVSPILKPIAGFIAWFIPTIEIMTSAILTVRRLRVVGLYASLILMLGFLGYILGIMNFSGSHIPCTCGGILQQMSWKSHIVFNSVFVVLCLLALYAEILSNKKRKEVEVSYT